MAGLGQPIGPAEWADVVPRLTAAEISALIQWLPDDDVPELLSELDPHQAATILGILIRPQAADPTNVVEMLPASRSSWNPPCDPGQSGGQFQANLDAKLTFTLPD